MINITISTEIDAPAGKVFAHVADFSNNPAWQSGVGATEWTSPPPIRVGSTYDQTVEFRDIVTSYKITAFEPAALVTTESGKGATIPTTVTRSVKRLGENRCRVTVDLTAKPRLIRRLSKPLLVKMIRDSTEADYRRLKRQLEAGGQED